MSTKDDGKPPLTASAPSKFEWLFARLKIETVLSIEGDVGPDEDGRFRPIPRGSGSSTWHLTEDCLYRRSSEGALGGDRIPLDRRFDAALILDGIRGVRADRMADLVADLCAVSEVVVISVDYPISGGHRANHHWPEAWSRLFEGHDLGCFDVFGPQPSRSDDRYFADRATLVFARRGTEAAEALEPWNATGLIVSRLRPDVVFSLLDRRSALPDLPSTSAREQYARDVAPLVEGTSVFVDAHADWRRQIEDELAFAKSMATIERHAGMLTGERRGRATGLQDGREAGLHDGREGGLRDGREAGLRDGREAGLRDGREAGLREGRDAGLRDGREAGSRDGREAGFRDGHDVGVAFATEQFNAEINRMSERHDEQVLIYNQELQRLSRLIEGYRSAYFRAAKSTLLKILLSVLPDAVTIRWNRRTREMQTRCVRVSGEFDTEYYRKTYPDVADSGADLLEHYLSYGAAEGRNPSAVFDTDAYLIDHPELVMRNINPLVHSLKTKRSVPTGKAP